MAHSRLVVALLGATLVSATAQASFVNFESGHVRPLALTPSKDRLLAVNTPDNRLAIYDATPAGLSLAAEVPVGLEPVAVAVRTNAAGRVEAWVVNHLSDSVSIVELDPTDVGRSRVTRTLLVGDEPRDVVFAGPGFARAFVTCAHRGQNRPGNPQLTTPGVGRADVWVFNADSVGASLGGSPLGGAPLVLFADTPRALAVSPDGATVYAAAFHSGNRTTAIIEPLVTAGGGVPPAPPGATPGAPRVGLIVKYDPQVGQWRDELSRNWSSRVAFTLADRDVFRIDATANPPVVKTGTFDANPGVGTILFNMAVNPATGKLYVSNTNARNEVRFEPVINGNLVQSRISVIDGAIVRPVHLNPHIDYGVIPGPPSEVEQTLAFPTDMTFSSDGDTLFVAAFGSGKVGVLDASDLENGIVDAAQVEVGLGPSGVALDESRNRLYVMNRIDHTISVVSDVTNPLLRAETAVVSVGHDPSPDAVRLGRRFLYDARETSAHGDQACASCHIFGDFDSIAWDLGDPFGVVEPNPNPFRLGSGGPFHPLKGPMTTQSLRGMADAGPMHWRGDKTGGAVGGDALDEDLAFKEFNPAFVGLLGRADELTEAEMQAFTDFILTVVYPPNPIRALDDSLTPAEQSGQTFFLNTNTDAGTCNNCHRVPFGTDGLSSVEGETQEFKIPHLRNAYQKIGMFGVPSGLGGAGIPPTGHLGDQVRGYGFLHDGGIPTLFNFVQGAVFQNLNDTLRRNLEAFMLAFDTGLAPAVGQQVSATPATFNDGAVVQRVTLLAARDDAGDCELVAKGIVGGLARGWVYTSGGFFRSDRHDEPTVGTAALRSLAGTSGQEVTFTCTPPGSGTRIGVDRDEDGVFDRRELDCGTDPTNPASKPTTLTGACGAGSTTSTTTSTSTTTTTLSPAGAPTRIQTTSLSMKDGSATANPAKRGITFKASTKRDTTPNRVVPPSPGGEADPTFGNSRLVVFNTAGSGEAVSVELPAAGWSRLGSETNPSGWRFRGASGDPITSVVVKRDSILVKGGKAAWGYTLDEPSQGRVAVFLQLGDGAGWCADAPAKASPAVPNPNDRVDRFKAASKTPAPAVCPAVP